MTGMKAALGATMIAILAGASAQAIPASPLESGAAVEVRPLHDVSTADLRRGDSIDLVVAQDVVKDGYVVIPRGTPGQGIVTYRTGKGGFGKSGKMEFDLVDLTIDGRPVPVSGHYRIAGQGKTTEVVIAWVIGGAAFASQIKGEDAVAGKGSHYAGVTGVVLAPQYAVDPARGAAGLDPYAAGRHAGMAARLASESGSD
ncbi:hypothetical protein [Sphingomonas abietis]|uniref:Uncharacterized protein n=1 Tax=Sphingomonas abietis TaxID=3012344 RepID=A0ABY7NQ89_9SPHN|nr:hypothetical protein [Sphingomonas abietis]WBO22636.1 hypothetical protein PBT88_00320 [Sphingomonas abietis]